LRSHPSPGHGKAKAAHAGAGGCAPVPAHAVVAKALGGAAVRGLGGVCFFRPAGAGPFLAPPHVAWLRQAVFVFLSAFCGGKAATP